MRDKHSSGKCLLSGLTPLSLSHGHSEQRRPEIFLFAAKYGEEQGDLEGAKYNFSVAHHLGPGLLEATIKHANFERRQGDPGAGVALYEQALETEKAKEASPSLPYLYLQYARFLDQVSPLSMHLRSPQWE